MAHTALATATARLDQMLVHLADKAGVGLDEKREMLHSLMGELAGSISALLTVAVLVAVVGIANTMSLSVSERSREHALLRALGLTRAQLRRTLLQEAVLIALTAAGIGALLGAVYGTLSVSLLLKGHGVGEFTVVVPWEPIVGTLLVGLIAGILAALLPSRRAARLSPVAALSME